MTRRAARPTAFAAISVAAVLAAAGCGSGGYFASGDASNGKTQFTAKCGGCHTLADAGTKGRMGPNLDLAFGYVRKQGFAPETIRQVVADQILWAQGAMPRNLVTGQDATDVATYVEAVAGTNPSVLVSTPAPPVSGMPTGSGARPSEASLANGAKVYVEAGCGSCHTLHGAHSAGKVGYDLDALQPNATTVEEMVTLGGGVMPPFEGTLTKQQIRDVANYVALEAGGYGETFVPLPGANAPNDSK